jgi:hypothetical protein
MCWTEKRYHLLWYDPVLTRREMDNAASSYEQHDFVSSVVFEMLGANDITLLPPGEKPTMVRPLGVVLERKIGKFGSR